MDIITIYNEMDKYQKAECDIFMQIANARITGKSCCLREYLRNTFPDNNSDIEKKLAIAIDALNAIAMNVKLPRSMARQALREMNK